MITENQQKWLAALRSGEYQQTKYCLQDEDSFCCLGVACKVAEKENVNVHMSDLYSGLAGGNLFRQPEVKAWLNLPSVLMSLGMTLNDEDGLSFTEIADRMEQELCQLQDNSTQK